MKFPKSMHAEGWANHFDDAPAAPVRTSPKPRLNAGFRAGAKPVNANTPLHGDPLPYTRTASVTTPVSPVAYSQPAAAPVTRPVVRPAASPTAAINAPRSNATTWVIGAGLGALLIGGAVVMSRNMTPREPAAPMVVGQATPSPEDVQLQTAPPSTGLVTPAPDATPAPAEAPAVKAVDEAPAVKPAPAETRTPPVAVATAPAPKVQAPAPMRSEPAPVIRTLTPQPEVLAQATPAPVLREAPQNVTPVPAPAATPVAPTALPDTTAAPVVPPVAAAPVTPPLAQQAPAASDPVDTGISVQVRQALAADAVLSSARIAVSTDHGIVKLEGQAPDALARERATVVAAATTGVKAVDNRLTLPPMAALDKPLSNGG